MLCLQVDPRTIAFRGLAVRMAVATGRVTSVSTHPLTRRLVYQGPLVQLVEAMVGMIHGGQIIMDSATFTAISLALSEIGGRVPSKPDYVALNAQQKYALACRCIANMTESSNNCRTKGAGARCCWSLWP